MPLNRWPASSSPPSSSPPLLRPPTPVSIAPLATHHSPLAGLRSLSITSQLSKSSAHLAQDQHQHLQLQQQLLPPALARPSTAMFLLQTLRPRACALSSAASQSLRKVRRMCVATLSLDSDPPLWTPSDWTMGTPPCMGTAMATDRDTDTDTGFMEVDFIEMQDEEDMPLRSIPVIHIKEHKHKTPQQKTPQQLRGQRQRQRQHQRQRTSPHPSQVDLRLATTWQLFPIDENRAVAVAEDFGMHAVHFDEPKLRVKHQPAKLRNLRRPAVTVVDTEATRKRAGSIHPQPPVNAKASGRRSYRPLSKAAAMQCANDISRRVTKAMRWRPNGRPSDSHIF